MSQKFTLRPEYHDLVGATTNYSEGLVIDIVAELEKGEGAIIADDLRAVAALTAMQGEHGPLLQVEEVDEAPTLVLPSAIDQLRMQQQNVTSGSGATTIVRSSQVVEAVHDDASSGYGGLTVDELRSELQKRGLSVSGNKAQLVAALEASDEGSEVSD